MGIRDWFGGHDDDEYDRDYARAYGREYDSYRGRGGYGRDEFRGGEHGDDYRPHAGSAGHPRHRWWASARYAPEGRPGWYSGEAGSYGRDYRGRGLRAGGNQGPGRAWGMGGNVEMESEQYGDHPFFQPRLNRGFGEGRTPGPGGQRGGHFSFGMGARTDLEGWGRSDPFDVDLGPLPLDSLRRGSPRGGQQRAGSYYGHQGMRGQRYLESGPFRASYYDDDFGDVDDYGRNRYPDATTYYGRDYDRRPNRSSHPESGRSPMRGWNDETRGGTGYGTGYRR
jgi:hypothetical protein